jgi:enoyl-CoA hydratase/3-hydroxypropionyl-coenzyme A dehydratase
MPDFATLTTAVDDHVGRLTLNRPERLNALSPACLRELVDAARWFDDQTEVRVVVVAGAGRAFSAGADLEAFAEAGITGPARPGDLGRLAVEAIESMRAVTIARIHGHCVGGGVVLAAACDLRVATTDTRFSIPELALGIPLAWGGIPRLVREIGPAMTRELVMTARPFSAAEAKELGFLNRVVDPQDLDTEVDDLAAVVATRPGRLLTTTKRNVAAVLDTMSAPAHAFHDVDALEAAFADPECQAAMAAYIENLGR